MGKSYGFIEIPSTSAAITALDIMLKTADEAASQKSIKDIVAKAIIANPHEEIVKMVELSASRL